jgi:hypothetical protein
MFVLIKSILLCGTCFNHCLIIHNFGWQDVGTDLHAVFGGYNKEEMSMGKQFQIIWQNDFNLYYAVYANEEKLTFENSPLERQSINGR